MATGQGIGSEKWIDVDEMDRDDLRRILDCVRDHELVAELARREGPRAEASALLDRLHTTYETGWTPKQHDAYEAVAMFLAKLAGREAEVAR